MAKSHRHYGGAANEHLLAIVLVTGLYMYKFPKVDESGPSVITEIEPNSAAAKAGLQVGDRVVKFGDQVNPTLDYLDKETMLNGNHAMDVSVLRNGQRLNLSVTPRIDPKEGIGVIGWGYGNIRVTALEAGQPAEKAGHQSGRCLSEHQRTYGGIKDFRARLRSARRRASRLMWK